MWRHPDRIMNAPLHRFAYLTVEVLNAPHMFWAASEINGFVLYITRCGHLISHHVINLHAHMTHWLRKNITHTRQTDQGNVSLMIYHSKFKSNGIYILWEFISWPLKFATIFCTCHDSTAVMACANFWGNIFDGIYIETKGISIKLNCVNQNHRWDGLWLVRLHWHRL